MYAEALNELDGPHNISAWNGGTYNITRNITEMQEGIHPVRIRGGVPDYPANVYNDKDALRKS